MAESRNPDELGALWLKSGAKGYYMTGTINGVQVVVFPNTNKTPGSKQPDWRVLKSKPREQVAQATSQLDDLTDNDIPF